MNMSYFGDDTKAIAFGFSPTMTNLTFINLHSRLTSDANDPFLSEQ